MLSVTGMNKFYYIKDFTDMRCKNNRILAVMVVSEMAAVYLNVVSTVKLAGQLVWRFLWNFY